MRLSVNKLEYYLKGQRAMKHILSAFQVTCHPFRSDAYNSRGTAYAELGNIQAAIKDFNQTIKIDPKSVDAYYNRGLANFKQGNHKLALADFSSAIKINPNLADAYGNRGLAEYALGNKRNAVTDLQQAASLFQQQGNTNGYRDTQSILQQIQQ